MHFEKHVTPVNLRKFIKDSKYLVVKVSSDSVERMFVNIGCILHMWKDFILIMKSDVNASGDILHEMEQIYNENYHCEHSQQYIAMFTEFENDLKKVKNIENKEIQKQIQNCEIKLLPNMRVFKHNTKENRWCACKISNSKYIITPEFDDVMLQVLI